MFPDFFSFLLFFIHPSNDPVGSKVDGFILVCVLEA